jgi:hypothetical protein
MEVDSTDSITTSLASFHSLFKKVRYIELNRRRNRMEEITQKLQELAKSRRIQKLIYKQTNTKPANLFINDSSAK